LTHTVEKALKDLGDKLSDDEKKSATDAIAEVKAANDAIAAVKTAMAGDDKDDIEHKTQALEQASTTLMQRMYEQQQAAAGGGAGSTGGSDGSAPGGKQDDVLDAEFEEVKESDRKKA
jgi:molecular chaperone DnaK